MAGPTAEMCGVWNSSSWVCRKGGQGACWRNETGTEGRGLSGKAPGPLQGAASWTSLLPGSKVNQARPWCLHIEGISWEVDATGAKGGSYSPGNLTSRGRNGLLQGLPIPPFGKEEKRAAGKRGLTGETLGGTEVLFRQGHLTPGALLI